MDYEIGIMQNKPPVRYSLETGEQLFGHELAQILALEDKYASTSGIIYPWLQE